MLTCMFHRCRRDTDNWFLPDSRQKTATNLLHMLGFVVKSEEVVEACWMTQLAWTFDSSFPLFFMTWLSCRLRISSSTVTFSCFPFDTSGPMACCTETSRKSVLSTWTSQTKPSQYNCDTDCKIRTYQEGLASLKCLLLHFQGSWFAPLEGRMTWDSPRTGFLMSKGRQQLLLQAARRGPGWKDIQLQSFCYDWLLSLMVDDCQQRDYSILIDWIQ